MSWICNLKVNVWRGHKIHRHCHLLHVFWTSHTNVMFLFKHGMITQVTAAQSYAGFYFFVIKKYYFWLFYPDYFIRVFPYILFIILLLFFLFRDYIALVVIARHSSQSQLIFSGNILILNDLCHDTCSHFLWYEKYHENWKWRNLQGSSKIEKHQSSDKDS